MKISRIVDLHADAGWRVFSFLKIETDAGLIGWSEYNESYGSKGLTVVIMKLAEMLIGQDPRPVELITANLYARTRQAPGGLIQQAIAAIENALVDVKAKALGVPVCEMLGGPVRDRLRSTGRTAAPTACTTPRKWASRRSALSTTSASSASTCASAASRRSRPTSFCSTVGSGTLHARLRSLARRTRAQPVGPRRGGARQTAWRRFREGTGNDVEFLLDLNFNFKTEGYIRLVRAMRAATG